MFDATGDGLPKKVQLVSLNKPIMRRGLSRTVFRVSDKIGNREILRRLSGSFTATKLKLVTLLLRNCFASVISLNNLNNLRIIKARSLILTGREHAVRKPESNHCLNLRSNFHVENLKLKIH